MDQGSSDRIPGSSLILFASLVFSFTAYITFRALWAVAIPAWLFLAVLGLQFATGLLGSSKVLTRLGAASLSALIAVIASIAAVFLIFPPSPELQVAGGVGGGSALIFIMASFVAATREDPVPSGAAQPLVMGKIEDDPTVELIKYGEPDDAGAVKAPDAALVGGNSPETGPAGQPLHEGVDPYTVVEDKEYEFDELSDSRLGLDLGSGNSVLASQTRELEGDRVTVRPDRQPPSDPPGEPLIPEDWVEETARIMAYEDPVATTGEAVDGKTGNGVEPGRNTAGARSVPFFGMRTRYKVLDGSSGEHYGTLYGDEGYSTLDPVFLKGLVGQRLEDRGLRIVKLDWSNFDEIEVHIELENTTPVLPDSPFTEDTGEPKKFHTEGVVRNVKATPVLAQPVSADKAVEEPVIDETGSAVDPAGPRYIIYDRRTIQPMGPYTPEGDRPRIDRLTLYRMFPEYDFRTFQIDSIRWEKNEVRIFIRGEKKQDSRPDLQRPKGKPEKGEGRGEK